VAELQRTIADLEAQLHQQAPLLQLHDHASCTTTTSSNSSSSTSSDSIDEQWLVDMDDITLGPVIGGGALGRVQLVTWQRKAVAKQLYFLNEATMRDMGIELSASEMQQVKSSFLQECRINSQIRHPNIVMFLGVGIASNEPRLLLLEHMQGGSLHDLLYSRPSLDDAAAARQPLPQQQQLSLLIDVCRALDYLHSRQPPILHLDIKPANILLDASQQHGKLGDLGESHVIQSSRKLNNAMTASTLSIFGVGSPLYMAPEMKDADEIKSGRTDMFSFGVVIAELATNRPPQPGPEWLKVDMLTRRFVAEQERRAQDIAAIQDQQLQEIVSKLIVHAMAERYNARQVLNELEKLQRQ
jgi:serine/threonine protein kinase